MVDSLVGEMTYRHVKRWAYAPIAMNDNQDNAAPPRAEPSRPLAQRLAERLRGHRAREGMTQDQVAKRLGCHESAVSRWESGSRFPTGEDLVALADLFEVSIDELLGRGRQYAAVGTALVDLNLLRELEATDSVEAFDQLIEDRREQAVWFPVPDGAVLVPVGEAMRLTERVAEKFASSRYVDRLFRPRS